ncbi:hypothetical protein F4802DRAFT_187179 [Xylaria palmicola]|nr:hypothetical protein F4802DRAFT_187179 [Xylaria palmicola]
MAVVVHVPDSILALLPLLADCTVSSRDSIYRWSGNVAGTFASNYATRQHIDMLQHGLFLHQIRQHEATSMFLLNTRIRQYANLILLGKSTPAIGQQLCIGSCLWATNARLGDTPGTRRMISMLEAMRPPIHRGLEVRPPRSRSAPAMKMRYAGCAMISRPA